MNCLSQVADQEVSLMDIYTFLRNGWRTLALAGLIGGVIGFLIGYTIPAKYISSTSIQTGRVLGTDVESVNVLVEKLRSPTYYSAMTLSACGLEDEPAARLRLTNKLSPSANKLSGFVSISYKAEKIDTSVACLEAVLNDVRKNQNNISQRQIEIAKTNLSREREKLKSANESINSLSKRGLNFDLKENELPSYSLLASTIHSKETEISRLEGNIQKAEFLLTEPQTKPASFATPIYSPTTSVSPNHALLTLVGFFMGCLLGLVLVVTRKMILQQL